MAAHDLFADKRRNEGATLAVTDITATPTPLLSLG